jgi:hypothetical protein
MTNAEEEPEEEEPVEGAEAEPEDTPDPVPAPVPRRRLATWWLVVIGVAIGAVIGLGAAAMVRGDGDDEPATLTLAPVDTIYPPDQAGHAAQFLAAWERSRRATFVAEYTFERTLAGGETLETTRVVVQDPPRRQVRQGDSTTTTDDERALLCEPVGTETVCTERPGVDYDEAVADELAAWRTAIVGDAPAYAVQVPRPGCFDLQRAVDLVAPPYGEATRVCFDDATGAIRSRQITRASGSDTETAVRITATVTDSDWQTRGG